MSKTRVKPICRFRVPAGDGCAHEVEVLLYRTRAAMRRAVIAAAPGSESDTGNCLAACTWSNPNVLPLVARMHFNVQDLKARYVVHEAVHAATRRAELVGDSNGARAEETLASDVESISDDTLRGLRKRGFRA